MTLGFASKGRSGETPALSVRALSKRFGVSLVLDDVALDVMPGEIHGLLGQNGSGKSTLIKILAGFYDPEPGAKLMMYGRAATLPMPPGGARELGIAFVHQHLGLVPSLSVLENFALAPSHLNSAGRSTGGKRRRRREQHSSDLGLTSIRPHGLPTCRRSRERWSR